MHQEWQYKIIIKIINNEHENDHSHKDPDEIKKRN